MSSDSSDFAPGATSSGLPLHHDLARWSEELAAIERQQAEMEIGAAEAADRRRRRRSGSIDANTTTTGEDTTLRADEPDAQKETGDGQPTEYDDDDYGDDGLEQLAFASSNSSRPAPPPTAHVGVPGGRASGHLNPCALAVGLAAAIADTEQDDTNRQLAHTPTDETTQPRVYTESENMLVLDESPSTRRTKRRSSGSRCESGSNPPPDGFPASSDNGDTHRHMASGGFGAPPPTACGAPRSAAGSVSSAAGLPAAAATRISSHATVNYHHPAIGFGNVVDPIGVLNPRRASGGLLPSLDPALLRLGAHSSLPGVRTPGGGSSLPRTPAPIEPASASSRSAVRSQAGSGSATPQLRARRHHPLAPLEHAPEIDIDNASTLDLSALHSSLAPSLPFPSATLQPERAGLSSLALARAQRRRSSLPAIDHTNPISAELPPHPHTIQHATRMLQPIATTKSEEGSTPIEAPSSLTGDAPLSRSPNRPPHQHPRPTTPYSNTANFEAISKRRSLPPLGLANISEQLNTTAK